MKARKVRQSTLNMVSQHVDVEDIYITRTIEQSDQSLDEIIQKRYPLVLCGGGDGTAMRIIEQMQKKITAHNEAGGDFLLPRFGLLKLGTGNGWASMLKVPAKVKPIWSIRQLTEEQLKFRTFNMIESDGRLFHFGGFGYDSLILNDYIDLKNKFTKGFIWKLFNSLFGYIFAIAFVTIPKIAIHGAKMDVRITNNSDDPIYKITHSTGPVEVPSKKGDVFHEGPSVLVGGATTTNFGFDLKAYPYATAMPGYMNLRVANVSVPVALSNLKPMWTGKWETPFITDYLVKDVTFNFDKEFPLQLGGDPEGLRNSLDLRVSDHTVELLDFEKLALNNKKVIE